MALLDAAPTTRMNGCLQQKADPLTTFDLKRFNAIRGQQAQIGREIRSCLKELRQLRKDARAACTDEPDTALRNEPGHPPTANDDVPIPRYPGGFDLDEIPPNEPGNPLLPVNDHAMNPSIAGASGLRNEPGPDPSGALPQPVRACLERLLAAGDRPEPADLASPAALGRALRRPTVRAA